MKTQLILNSEAATIDEAYELAPWAAEIIEIEGGYKAFESITDLHTWQAQA